VDDGLAAPYAGRRMNLLLLLSALLSALTGVAGGVRAQPAAAQVMAAETRRALPAAARQARLASRPVVALPVLASLAEAAIAIVPAFAPPSLLLTTGRRRE
jgi:hypothetical protein